MIDPGDVHAIGLLDGLLSKLGRQVDAVLYLWPFEDKDCIRDYSCAVYILQAIASAKSEIHRILLVIPLH